MPTSPMTKNSEVASAAKWRGARQVPSFCTAEVLEADPDHFPPYLVAEYVDGPSLHEAVRQRGPMSPANTHAVALGVASALTAIHGAEVIHRDLKPRNVLLAPGSPKVIDFGIARAMESVQRHTSTGHFVGTVEYVPPERLDADAWLPVTPAADIFAWGAVVGYASTGRTPFECASMAATVARILTQPPDLNGIPPSLCDLVAASLEKRPDDRPTARELMHELTKSGRPTNSGGGRRGAAVDTTGERVAAAAASPPPRVRSGALHRRVGHSRLAAVIVTGAALMLAVVIGALTTGGKIPWQAAARMSKGPSQRRPLRRPRRPRTSRTQTAPCRDFPIRTRSSTGSPGSVSESPCRPRQTSPRPPRRRSVPEHPVRPGDSTLTTPCAVRVTTVSRRVHVLPTGPSR
jgi:serine/threonine protein kinase